jgi:predicted nucleotidyltransferase component of viral defense system
MLKEVSEIERQYYENFLYPFQDEILPFFGDESFYLSGGTCLSRFYYHHRYSDDLDIFFNGTLESMAVFQAKARTVIQKIGESFQTEVNITSDTFFRFFAYKNEQPLKIELIYENLPVIGSRIRRDSFFIDTKENITTNKLTAIYDRKTVKDYFDLYFLLQDINLQQVFEWAKLKMVPLDYESTFMVLNSMQMEGAVYIEKGIKPTDFQDFIKNFTVILLSYAKTI